MHTSHESRQGIIEWPTEDKPSVPRSIPKQDSALWELEKSYEALQQICSKHSSEMAQLETDAVTEIHRYQIFIVVFGVFSLCSYWGNYPEGSVGSPTGLSSTFILPQLIETARIYSVKLVQQVTEGNYARL